MKKLNILLASAFICAYIASEVYAQEIHTYGPIEPGEMLWNIAGKVSPASIDRHQAILALHRTNPHAFSISCNMNSLRVGEKLRIPSLLEMQAFSRDEAIKELNRQEEEWKNRHSNPIVCPKVEALPVPTKPSTTEVGKTTKPSTTVADEGTKPVPAKSSLPTTSATDSSSGVSTSGMVDHTEPVALVPDDLVDDSTPTSEMSSSIMIALLIGGLLAAVLVGWQLRKRAQQKKEEEALFKSTFSQSIDDPSDEMPLVLSLAEKHSKEKPLPLVENPPAEEKQSTAEQKSLVDDADDKSVSEEKTAPK